jgi:hypothetical protein
VAFTPLNSLHAYLSVALRLSFAAAAAELDISTSALSQSVRLLENAGPGVTQALESPAALTFSPR